MFIVTKKRKLREASASDGIVLDGKEELEERSLKRLRVPPTVTETIRELWEKMRADFSTIT